jgi:hypothetical protein
MSKVALLLTPSEQLISLAKKCRMSPEDVVFTLANLALRTLNLSAMTGAEGNEYVIEKIRDEFKRQHPKKKAEKKRK